MILMMTIYPVTFVITSVTSPPRRSKKVKNGACIALPSSAYYSLRESAVHVGVAELADALA